MKIKTFISKIEKFNGELADAVARIGENEFLDVDITIIGSTSTIEPLEYELTETSVIVVDPNCGQRNECGVCGGDMEDTWELDDVLDGIKLYKRMIKKTIRVWESENPDAEMEKEDEDE